MNFLLNLLPIFFGSSSNGKGIVDTTINIIDRFFPSKETKAKQALAASQAGDTSQKIAGEREEIHYDSWFDILIDGFNRLPRPSMAFWALGCLAGWWKPADLSAYDPISINILYGIVTFYFGARTISKDILPAIAQYREHRKKVKSEEKKKRDEIELSDYDDGEYEETVIR